MRFFQKDFLLTFGPAVLLVVAGFYIAYKFVGPAPPDTVTISTGRKDGMYYEYASRYREILARNDISLEIIESAGSGENIEMLVSKKADIAFVQGGAKKSEDTEGLLCLGSLFFEPLWVFYTGNKVINRLTGFTGQRIAVGGAGSGTQVVANHLLVENGLEESATFLPLGGMEAADALLSQKVDVAMMIASADSPVIQKLLGQKYVYLMDFSRAAAYARRHSFLSTVKLPEGVIDLEKNLPVENIRLTAATANLVIHEDLHPALIYLLMQAAEEIHGGPGIMQIRGQFPAADYLDYPLSDVARRFYKSGLPFLQRYLPFSTAVLIDQMIVMIVPLIAVLLPLIKLTPPIYQWRIRSRIFRWYKELREVDRKLVEVKAGKFSIDELRADLQRIEGEVEKLEIPISYEDRHYNLRMHINLVNSELAELESK